jgi:hypothetical protein
MRAGWDRPRLFIDSGVTIPERFDHLPLTFRETKLGAWPNYYLALAELLMREPDADAFLILQDDALLHHRHPVREYLEQALWPVDPIGAVSLYCSKAYTRAAAGWHALEGEWIWGALAFIFSGASARRFLADPAVLEHRTHPEEGLANVDGVIGRWAVRHQLPIYYPTPSLVQHIGEVSSLWPTARALGYRRADRFAGDMLQFPPDPAPEA